MAKHDTYAFYRRWPRNIVMARNMRRRMAEVRRRRKTDAQERALPSFLIAGVMKGGTTSLFDYLSQHPNVLPPLHKETYFCFRKHANPGHDFRAFFPLQRELDEVSERTGHAAISGEATPETMFLPRLTRRAAEAAPGVKVIALLREPLSRAYSHHQHNVVRRKDRVRDFAEALRCEDERTAARIADFEARDDAVFGGALNDFTYLRKGFYAPQIESLHELFGRENTLVIASERLFRETGAVYAEVLAFLGLPAFEPDFKAKNTNEYDPFDASILEGLSETLGEWNQRLNDVLGRPLEWSR
ncbi:MAG: sulfotransferase domain-containing protein [Planctomycetota bacterium]